MSETQAGTAKATASGSLFRTKSIDLLTVESGSAPLKRTLGPLSLVALGIGAIIGAGLFVRTAAAIAERAGPSVTLAFLVAGHGCASAGAFLPQFASTNALAGAPCTAWYAAIVELVSWV